MSMVNLGPISLRGFNINREYQTFKITELDESKKYYLTVKKCYKILN